MNKFTLLFTFFLLFSIASAQNQNFSEFEKARLQLEQTIQNHPYKKALDKPVRLPNGKLPPDLYFKQDYLQTMDPTTGKIDASKLTEIRKDVANGLYHINYTPQLLRVPGTDQDPWVSRGPYDTGGRTRAIMFDPNDENGTRIFAGGTSGGLWVNDDISDSFSEWQQVSSYWANNSISCIVSDPNNPQIFYVGTGEVYVGDVSGLGIWKTEDGGATWSHIFNDTFGYTDNGRRRGNYFITDIAVRDNNGVSELFVGVSGRLDDVFIGSYEAGLYKSIDGGNTFQRVEDLFYGESQSTDLDVYYNINRIKIAGDNSIWVGTMNDSFSGTGIGGKIFKSTNGNNFELVYEETTGNTESGRVELGVSSQNGDVAYALLQVYSQSNPVKIIKTIDGGANWTEMPLPVDSDPGIPENDFTRGQSFYDLVIAVDPQNHDNVYVGGIDLHRSLDGGTTWEQISKWYNWNEPISYVHADQHAIVFNPQNPTEMVFGHDGGISWAEDNSSFQQPNVFVKPIKDRNRGYNVTQFYSAKLDPTATLQEEAIMGGTQDNGTIVLTGAANESGIINSFQYTGGDGGQVEFDDEGNYAINGYVYSYHYLTNLNTNNLFYLLPENLREYGSFINEVTLDPIQDVAYTYRSGISYNVVSGLNGANATEDLSVFRYSISPFTSGISKMKVSPYTTSSTTLFVGAYNGNLYKVTNANSEEEASHIRIETPIVGSISDISFGPSEQHIVVTVSNYNVQSVWYTTDGGETWLEKEGNLPDMPIRAVMMNPNNANEVILGTDLGVWSTANFLAESPTWGTSINGMSYVKVLEFDYREADGTVLAATYGRGIFTTENGFLSTQDINSRLTNFVVYPQPSKGTLHIKMDEVEHVDIQIYDTTGKLVFTAKNIALDEPFVAKLPKGIYVLKATNPNGFEKTVNLMMK